MTSEHDTRETSLEAYYSEIEPDLGRRQKIVLLAFHRRNVPSSDKEIANFLSNPINSITPRRNELVKKELVEEAERGECEVTGRRVIKWRLSDKGYKRVGDIDKSIKELMEDG